MTTHAGNVPAEGETMRRKQVLLMTSAMVVLWAGQASAQQATNATPPNQGVAASGTAATADRARAAAAKSGIVVEELVVTAKEHNVDQLREAPVAATTYNAEQRNLVGANTITDLVNLTPGVTISSNGMNMRGVGRQTNETATLGSTPGIAYYVNGFYNLVASNIGESTLFSETVQFQRGPQGTRYGRETIGGTASLWARRPPSEFRGEVVGQYGSRGFWGLGANFGAPINDRYGMRFGVQYFGAEESTQKNLGPVEAGFLSRNAYYELQLEGRPTDQAHFWLRSTTFAYNSPPGYGALARYNATGAMGSLVPNPQYGLTTTPPRPRNIDVDTRGIDKLRDNQVHILNADYDLGAVTAYYVGGYAQYKAIGYSDFDNTSRAGYTVCNSGATCAPGTLPFAGVANGRFIWTRQEAAYLNRVNYFTHELRLENNDKTNIDWVVGAFYYKHKFDYSYEERTPNEAALANPTTNFNPASLAAPNPTRASYQQHNIFRPKSWALFGDVLLHPTANIDVYGGLRYSDEQGNALTSVRYIFFNPAFGVSADVTPGMPFGLAGPSGANLNYHDKAWTGRLGVNYHFSDDTMLYVKYARGFKPSAFRVDNVTSVATNLARAETLDAYEAGLKSQITPEFYFDVTTFYYKYQDMQIPLTVLNAANQPSSQYTNVDDARTWGIEVQSTWTPISEVWLNANYSYLNAQTEKSGCAVDAFDPTTSGPNPGCPVRGVRLDGRRLPRTPEHKLSFSGAYSWHFTPGSLIVGGNVTYVSEQQQDAFENKVFTLPSTTYTNASITWRSDDNAYDVILQANNIFDKDYITSIVAAPLGGGGATTAANLGGPRFVQIQVRRRW